LPGFLQLPLVIKEVAQIRQGKGAIDLRSYFAKDAQGLIEIADVECGVSGASG
jgi:hypothetical protein